MGPLTNNNNHAWKIFFKSFYAVIRYIFPLDYDFLHRSQFIIMKLQF